MPEGFAQLYTNLRRYADAVEEAVGAGLADAAPSVTSQARSTSAYQDQTGATRESTVAFVVSKNSDGGGEVAAAKAAAQGANPGSVLSFQVSFFVTDVQRLILTAFTHYIEHLERSRAGIHASIGPAMAQSAQHIHEAVARKLREVRV